MNQKADKAQLKFPFSLQLMHDEPVVDAAFQNAERINAPYINDMICPVYIQDTGSKAIYDNDGNRYEVIDNEVVRNGEYLFAVSGKHFKREDVTETFIGYHDYDLDDSSEAYTMWNDSDNSFTIHAYNNDYSTGSLYMDGTVIGTRIRVLGNATYFVIIYDINDIEYYDLYIIQESGTISHKKANQIRWYTAQIKRTASDDVTYTEWSKYNSNPIINIGIVKDGVVGISFMSGYGRAVNCREFFFATYFIVDNATYQIGYNAKPTNETSSIVVTNNYSQSFRFVTSFTKEQTSIAVISSNSSTFYKLNDDNTKGEEVSFPNTYYPTDVNRTIAIDGVTYNIYNANGTKYTGTIHCACRDSLESFAFTATPTLNDVTYPEITSDLSVNGVATISVSEMVYSGMSIPVLRWGDCKVDWRGEVNSVETWRSGEYFTVNVTSTSTVDAGWLVSPNIVLDTGELMSFWTINYTYQQSNNWSSQYLSPGNVIEESGYLGSFSIEDDEMSYTITPESIVEITSYYDVARSNSFIYNQGLGVSTVRLNNQGTTSPHSMSNGGTESQSSYFLEYSNSNATDLRYYPGTTNDTSFNYYGFQTTSNDTITGPQDDYPPFVVQGYRVPVRDDTITTPFNLLYNTDITATCLPQGISYSNDKDEMGTLLTPWQSIDDDFYVAANSVCCVYRDKSNRYYRISIEDGSPISFLLDRYVLVNTTSYWNMYDTVLNKKFHYATDYNGRLMFGQTAVPEQASALNTQGGVLYGANSSGRVTFNRYTADGINAAYTIMPMYGVSSIMLPRVLRQRVYVDAERPFRCNTDSSDDVQPIDVYYGLIGGTTAPYRYSVYPYVVYDRVSKFDLVNSTYTTSTVSLLSPNMFTEYISGAGNNDMVKETYSTYVLTYYDNIPFFTYSANSEVASSYNESIDFFVLQGQFYAYKNNKIYSMIYSNGSITQEDAIIDAKGMKFIGNNPMIAFFWDPRSRSIRSFTGDANLEHLWNANKFSELRKHWYDETTQSIYVSTDIGLLVLADKSVYLIEDWKDVTNVQFDSVETTHITNGDTTINLSYYPRDGYSPLELDLETSFYGLGNNEYTSIDRWDIVLYDITGSSPSTEITAGVRSITDITVASESKTLKITPDMWDKWSHSVLIRYVPKLVKGQGIRLYLKTPMIVQRIVPHIMDMGTGTVTRRGM